MTEIGLDRLLEHWHALRGSDKPTHGLDTNTGGTGNRGDSGHVIPLRAEHVGRVMARYDTLAVKVDDNASTHWGAIGGIGGGDG